MSKPLVKARVSIVMAVRARNGRRQAVVLMVVAPTAVGDAAGIAISGTIGSERVKNGIRAAAQMTPSPTVRKAIQPAVEWKPSTAIAGEIQIPTSIKAVIRTTFASQMSATPMGRSRSDCGKR